MNINRYVLSELPPAERRRITTRTRADDRSIEPTVREIIATVRERGDAALVDYGRTLDGVELAPDRLQVSAAEMDAAEAEVSPDLRKAIELAVANIRTHHQAQMQPATWMREISPGVISGERLTPIASVGLYVPRGKGSFPSVTTMLCAPAVLAGVPQIVMCTPPGPGGTIDAASVVAARLCGVTRIFKVGGAQAVAALAFGTETVPRVDKIIGPGNPYVSVAKRLLYGTVDPGLPAGPSESIVLCDDTADPEVVARELLVEAEHGPDSAALLVTDSGRVADAVAELVPGLVDRLPDQRRHFCTTVLAGFGGIVLTTDLDDSVDFVNQYAPEHLRLIVDDPFTVLHRIQHAGEVLLGEHASIAFGNFAIGLNAILPTGGSARSQSCVGIADFMKRSSFAYVSPEGVEGLGTIALELAAYEGFPSHLEAARHAVQRAGARRRGDA